MRQVRVSMSFGVDDDTSDDDVASIVADASVQVREAVIRLPDGWNERDVATYDVVVTATVDGKRV